MRLSKTALQKINTKQIRPLLALALNKSEGTIIRYISDNDENLTKAAATNVIREHTDILEAELFEQEVVSA